MIDLMPQLCVFKTDFGWSLLSGRQQRVESLLIGCDSAAQALESYRSTQVDSVTALPESTDWYPEARQAIEAYSEGAAVDFRTIRCDLSARTPFQQAVLQVVRDIPRGEVLTYGEVARRVNRPGAARAVGATMARNPIPLIIPCHRVIGSDGKLTGFSAPRGIALKQILLELEQSDLELMETFPWSR